MKETCKAAVLCEPGDLRIKDVPVPEVGPGEILVQVKSCSDLVSGLERFTYSSYTVMGGLGVIPVIMGLLGVAED